MTLTNSYLTTCAYALALRRASLTSALALLLWLGSAESNFGFCFQLAHAPLLTLGCPVYLPRFIGKWWIYRLPGCLMIRCHWLFIYSMVVGVRKNRISLLENKFSYIFCVVGAGVTNAEWAWWFVKLHQRCWLACWFVYLCVHFNILSCVLWNLNQLWLGYSFDSGVVRSEINVWYCFWKCEKLLFVPLLKFSATSQTLSTRHTTMLPLTHLLHNASGIEVFTPTH